MYYLIGIIILAAALELLAVNRKQEASPLGISEINFNEDELGNSEFNKVNFKYGFNKMSVLRNLKKNYIDIVKAHEFMVKAVRNKKNIGNCAEWLLDNFYLIEREYKEVKNSGLDSFYKYLPKIKSGIYKGVPRIFLIGREIVKSSDGRIYEKDIETYITEFQKKSAITIGELWVLPIMIRAALLENLSKIVQGLVFQEKEINKGEQIADKIINSIYENNFDAVIRDVKKEVIDYNSHFVTSFIKVLRENSADNYSIYHWIEGELEKKNTSIDIIINQEHQKQAACEILMGNCISGIRDTANLNWKETFERLSLVEKILREDPYKLYELMDYESRDYYRHSVEELSRKSKLSEIYIAKKSIECAKEALENKESLECEKHVGYYLVDDGIAKLKKKLGCKNSRFISNKKRVPIYLAAIVIGTFILDLGLCILNYSNYPGYRTFDFILAFFAAVIPCSEIIISTLNWSLNYIFVPRFIPKLEYSEGIPEENSTIIVIPFMLESVERVKNLTADMEVYYLSNREKNTYFALLGDFTDSRFEINESDEMLVNTAIKEVNKLNKKYCLEGKEIFYFLNRIRKYNEKQSAFMGWERKRGKLIEFNKLLRGDKNTSYKYESSSIDNIKGVKYVITLDSDTKLPMNSVKRLVGAMSHVLNKPVMDSKGEKILRGHGLMQPRISINTLSANKTIFSRMFSGEAGIDIYSTSVSDVYEDLFDQGIYTGKGIYEVDIFMKVLEGKIPENIVLSHDLLEGSFARAALVTDVEFIDDYPAYYTSSCKRLHRWVRGDWQIYSWITKRTSLNLLSRWKIFDNLRRSLLAPSIFLMIALSLTILPGEGEWFITAFASIMCPILFDVSEGIIYHSKNLNFNEKMKRTTLVFEKVLLVFAFLPYKAYLMMDAVIRTIYRLKVSKRNLLEWQTSENTESNCGRGLMDYIKTMSPGVVAAFIILLAAFTKNTYTGILFIPYCILWVISPFIAWYIGIAQNKIHILDKNEEEMLRIISRKTWAYFEDFVTEEDNWLAPDNYQELPNNGIAHRTSPTNLGMGLISNISAFDMGYIGIVELIERLEKILSSMDSLTTYKGHFYNWYDTKTKKPLSPEYISTVDSGNLAGYLLVISESLDEYMKGSIHNENMISGFLDILIIAQTEVENEMKIKEYYTEEIKKYEHCSLSKDILPGIKEVIAKCENINMENPNLYWNKKLNKFLFSIIKEINLEPNILAELNERMKSIRNKLLDMVEKTDFSMLYDKDRELFTIGYNVDIGEASNCYYDLLASESRQASFIAIAKGDVEQGHWFKLGRSMVAYGNSKGLVSWSGTMFEYFMPLLIMKNFPDTLMYETCKAVVKEQIEYPKGRSGFWGISESAFYKFDINMNYQYKAFGVPGTALKRIGNEELVISPYSSLLAMMVNLTDSLINIKNMFNSGLIGRYGFYEAVEYTTSRIPKGYQRKIIKNYMVHHQGMSLLAIHNVLKSDILKNRFHNIAEVRAAELLLQEKVPKTLVYKKSISNEVHSDENKNYKAIPRRYEGVPVDLNCHLLSNGEYSLMVTNRGGGYSKYGDTMLYRWRKDSVCDSYGMFFYLKNLNSGDYWSATFEPSKVIPDKYEVTFTEDKAQYERLDGNITTKTEITVSQEDNAEIRKITLINHGDSSRDIEITSYLEAVITNIDADTVHPGFSNLFISTEYVESPKCLLAARRPRTKNDKKNWIMHSLTVEGEILGKTSYETSRAEFIGRCRNLESPLVMEEGAPLKNTIGAILDPVLSLRVRIKLRKGKKCVLYFSMGISDSRDKVLDMAKKYSDPRNTSRVFNLSWTQSILELKYMEIKSPKANIFQDLASRIMFINSSLRERENLIKKIKRGQSALWCYGISGDMPIVSIVIHSKQGVDDVKQGIIAHEYLSRKGLKFDLVIINLEESDYIQPLQNSLRDLADFGYASEKQNKPGGIFILNRAAASLEDIDLIQAVSRFVIDTEWDSFIWKIKNAYIDKSEIEPLKLKKVEYNYSDKTIEIPKLIYFNGFGGFSSENNSYVIILKDKLNTPAPWINVISNEKFGFQVSENGVGYTWNINSRENKLTRWSNDPVRDSECESLFLRDEITGVPFGISPKPFRDSGEYIIEHGLGYSSFKHSVYGIDGEMTMFVPKENHVKLIRVKLKNTSDKVRKISLTYYCRVVLGVTSDKTAPFIYSEYESNEDYIYSVNPYSEHFAMGKCYLKVIGGIENSYTGDRNEFIGSNYSIDNPEFLRKARLSNNTGAGYDPCLAVNSKITLDINEEKEVIILFGEEMEKGKIKEVISKYNSTEKVTEALREINQFWRELTGTFQVETPDKSLDIMLNGWLVYQTLVCRIWARSAFYQSGGAFGFRDQLQDVMSISWLDPSITRKHIIYSASRQFKEGDVQHWWHPVIESGIRTRFSDDLLWLPYVTADYIKSTGDYSILKEEASFMEDIPLEEGEDERYSVSRKSEEKGSIYDHCIRALDRALKYGPHNIPLMGSGDWNDGFSTIGNGGSGESIWLGWFIFKILGNFIPLCEYMKDEISAQKYLSEKNYIIFNMEENAWDGDWYRRAYFDDGTPLGSFKNDECQIDSLAQSWGIISGGAKKSRGKTAMRSLEKHLVREDKAMVVLFSPPFDKSKMEPGYIKGYLPGVRENGGQYTHAAVWVVIAMAMLGNNKALEIFNMLNPINHTKSNLDCEIYKTEPYVMAADVYGVSPHIGRGGWSWYTGASGWMYRAGLEFLLGLKLVENKGFKVEPCIPDYWDKFKVKYRRGECLYNIKVSRGDNKGVYVEKNKIKSGIVPYFEKGEFKVEVII